MSNFGDVRSAIQERDWNRLLEVIDPSDAESLFYALDSAGTAVKTLILNHLTRTLKIGLTLDDFAELLPANHHMIINLDTPLYTSEYNRIRFSEVDRFTRLREGLTVLEAEDLDIEAFLYILAIHDNKTALEYFNASRVHLAGHELMEEYRNYISACKPDGPGMVYYIGMDANRTPTKHLLRFEPVVITYKADDIASLSSYHSGNPSVPDAFIRAMNKMGIPF